MTTFRYSAYDTAGKSRTGSVEADGYKSAIEEIKKNGLYPTDVKTAGSEGGFFSRVKPISAETLALTTRQFSTLLLSGTPLTEALSILSENCANRRLGGVLLKLKEGVVGGATLSSAMAAHPEIFSPFYRGLISSAEVSGGMETVLLELADYLESRARTLRELKTALTYPVLMLAVGVIVVGFLFVFVVPKITRIFEESNNSLPLITTVLIFITDTVLRYWPLFILAVAGLAAGSKKYYRHKRVRPYLDRLLLRTPWVGKLASSFFISTMCRTLGSLLSGGVPLLGALEVTKGVLSNVEYKRIMDTAIQECAEGSALSASLKNSSNIPSMVAHMINVGEKSGNLDSMLLTTAKSYEEQFSTGLKRAITLIEPLMILAMGLIVGLIVLAILLPIFELNQIIR